MWDSYIPKIMELQSKYPCFVLKRNESLTSFLEERMRSDSKFYIVPDYSDSQDAKRIVSCFGDNFLYSGGSGLLEFLFDFSSPEKFFRHLLITARSFYVEAVQKLPGCKYNILAKIMNVYLSMNPVMI